MPKKKGGKPESAPSTSREAAADDETDDVEEEETKGNKRDGADISKVTDYVEQKELDSAKASQAIASLGAEVNVDREAELARERELAAVKIEQVRPPKDQRYQLPAHASASIALLLSHSSPDPCDTMFRSQADVDLIAAEMELDKEASERCLREHKGDVVAALTTLVAAPA
jgi:hypothetical protein